MEQMLLVYDLPKETVTTTMMLYKNIKTTVSSSDGEKSIFDIVAGVLSWDKHYIYL